ncbi:MAG: hypothetical protein DHS20C04_13550 [Hyphococcus sp.]|nr:MAG: hypothetical protein DHS20C04_13550 [Marinicaulis sp.]
MPEPSMKDRLTGGSTSRTVIKLVIASIIVGAVFSFFRIGVREFWSGVFENVRDLVGTLGESFGEIALTLGTYLLIGAGVVIPIWLISRLLSSRK